MPTQTETSAADQAVYAKVKTLLDLKEAQLKDWLSGGKPPIWRYPLDTGLLSNDSSAAAVALQRRARGLTLQTVYKGMASTPILDRLSQWELVFTCVEDSDTFTLLENPENCAALLSCIFTVQKMQVLWRGAGSKRASLTAFLHQWLPETASYTVTAHISANALADMIFDPTWRTLYDIDFDGLPVDQCNAVLLTGPPLRGRTPVATLSPSSTEVTLPDNIQLGT